MNTLFCDGLKDITIRDGIVRLEFFTTHVDAIDRVVIVMPLKGFGSVITLVDRIRDKLMKDGVLKPSENVVPNWPLVGP
jgi:hypothetical protein